MENTTTITLGAEYANGGAQIFDAEARLCADRIIFISGSIDDDAARYTASKLMLMAMASDDDITICLQSPGGSIEAGMIICDMINLINCDVRTIGMGTVASMGAMIFATGTHGKRYMLPSAKLMIHEPLTMLARPLSTSDIISLGHQMKKLKTRMSTLLANATGQSVKTIDNDTKTDKYFDAQEAIDYGLADKIFDQESFSMLML